MPALATLTCARRSTRSRPPKTPPSCAGSCTRVCVCDTYVVAPACLRVRHLNTPFEALLQEHGCCGSSSRVACAAGLLAVRDHLLEAFEAAPRPPAEASSGSGWSSAAAPAPARRATLCAGSAAVLSDASAHGRPRSTREAMWTPRQGASPPATLQAGAERGGHRSICSAAMEGLAILGVALTRRHRAGAALLRYPGTAVLT